MVTLRRKWPLPPGSPFGEAGTIVGEDKDIGAGHAGQSQRSGGGEPVGRMKPSPTKSHQPLTRRPRRGLKPGRSTEHGGWDTKSINAKGKRK